MKFCLWTCWVAWTLGLQNKVQDACTALHPLQMDLINSFRMVGHDGLSSFMMVHLLWMIPGTLFRVFKLVLKCYWASEGLTTRDIHSWLNKTVKIEKEYTYSNRRSKITLERTISNEEEYQKKCRHNMRIRVLQEILEQPEEEDFSIPDYMRPPPGTRPPRP
jgi:hypothetical protein